MFIKINKRIVNVNHIIEIVDFSWSGGPRQMRLTPQDAASESESRFDLTFAEYENVVKVLQDSYGLKSASDAFSPKQKPLTKGEQKLRLATAEINR